MLGLVLAMTLAAPATRIVVLPLQAQGPTPEAMQQLDAAVRIELGRIQGLELVTLAPRASAPDCQGKESCMAELGRRLGASEVLHGEARALADSFAVTLRLLDVETGRQRASTSSSVNRDVEEMVWATRAQVVRLKAPERWKGLLAVEAEDARVFLDGTRVDARELTLAPGTYAVRLEMGPRVAQAWVDVRYEQRASVRPAALGSGLEVTHSAWQSSRRGTSSDGHWEATPGRPRARWPQLTVLAVGGGLLVGGLLEQLHARSLRAEIEGMRQAGGAFPIAEAARVRDLQSRVGSASAIGWTLLGAGAAVSLGGTTWFWIETRRGSGEGSLGAAGSF